MTIDIATLKSASDKIFAYLEEANITEIPLEHDLYWVMKHKEALDPTKEPRFSGLGQLTDNYDAMVKIANNNDENEDDAPIPYNFVWLATLLDYIGHRAV
ncbi:hypothetical protein [Kiloniella sp.]|uniref:hypothetical protein n=1 Tax=Kiloniella sp. TaxID=1938587 RepID=UPI003A93DD8A